ncbi:endonuclease IV [Escherichia phage vB_Eco_F26]|nr:endonuclease IV [Escherichia phage vB_Eco_F26]
MQKTNPGLQRLFQIPTFTLSNSNLTSEMKVKIADTARYSLKQNPNQDKAEVIERCRIAVYAEFFVADWLSGYVNKGQEDVDDPYTYAWDVLAHPKYCGLRVEVKTHQTDSRWISVTTGCSGEYPYGSGINLGPILNHQVADCIIIFNTKEIHPGVIQYTPKFIGDREDLRKVVRKSNYNGWYLSI